MITTPTWNGNRNAWTCEVDLPDWKPFLRTRASDRVEVSFLPPDGAPADAPPTPVQLETLAHLVTVQAELRRAVEVAIRVHYDSVRPKYAAFAQKFPDFMGDPATSMPQNPDALTLGRLLDLDGLFVHADALHGLAYVGFSFHATWEPEHGIGVVTHDRRVVGTGAVRPTRGSDVDGPNRDRGTFVPPGGRRDAVLLLPEGTPEPGVLGNGRERQRLLGVHHGLRQ